MGCGLLGLLSPPWRADRMCKRIRNLSVMARLRVFFFLMG